MANNHSHWLSGRWRVHSITCKHKDPKAIRSHNSTIETMANAKPAPAVKNASTNSLPLQDGYLYIDVDNLKQCKGVRLKFTRKEGGKKRTVGLQIEKIMI